MHFIQMYSYWCQGPKLLGWSWECQGQALCLSELPESALISTSFAFTGMTMQALTSHINRRGKGLFQRMDSESCFSLCSGMQSQERGFPPLSLGEGVIQYIYPSMRSGRVSIAQWHRPTQYKFSKHLTFNSMSMSCN